jgi:hypothetical protein
MDVKLAPGDTIEFALELETISAMADSDFLDRLADLVYEIDDLSDVVMGLNPDGSIRASFVVKAATSLEAAQDGLDKFMRAFVEAKPLRLPEHWVPGTPSTTVLTIGVAPANRLVPA